MSHETFNTDHGTVITLNKENYPLWKEKISRVLMANKAYNIVSCVELPPVGKGIARCSLQECCRNRANTPVAQLLLGCCVELLPLIYDIEDRMETWEPLRHRLDSPSGKHGCTQALRKFTAFRPSPDETVTKYFSKLINFCKKLIATTDNITDGAM